MYFPIGWSKTQKVHLKIRSNEHSNEEDEDNCDEKLLSIKTSSDKSFLCVLTNFSLRIWFCKPSVEIVSHFRNQNSIRTLGLNKNATWKPDSSMIIIQTTLDFLLFYKIVLKYDDQELFVQNNIGSKRDSFEIRSNDKIPALLLELAYCTKIDSGITSIMAAEEEAIICTQNGEILGVNWDGSIDENFNWNLNDNQYSSSSNPNLNTTEEHDPLFYVINHEYSSAIGGFSLVFANGKAAFLPLKNEEETDQLPENISQDNRTNHNERKYCIKKLHFVNDVDNAIVTAINHKYQILAFGLKNSEAVLCYIDDPTSTVVITHHLSLSPSSFPNANNLIGSLVCLQWSPDSSVLAASWEKGGFVIWSVFGSLLSCSLGWDYGSATNQNKYKLNIYDSLAWGKEGFQLWTLEKTLVNPTDTTTISNSSLNNSLNNSLNSQHRSQRLVYKTNLSQFSMVKSILASNPSCISNCGEHVLLIGEDRLYLGFEATNTHNQRYDTFVDSNEYDNLNDDNLPSTNTANIQWEHQSTSLGNHQWVIIAMPPSYYNTNSPIRYASIDQTGQYIAIAGKNGFALYSMLTRKWKLFGNETQEKDFEVYGGLIWFKEMIVMGCFNLIDYCFEIRVYSLNLKLDNQNAKIVKVPCDILLMSINKNHLLVYLLDGSFYLYGFYELKRPQANLETSIIPSASSSLSLNSYSKLHQSSSLKQFNQTNQSSQQRYSNLSSFHLILMHQIVSNVIVPPECVTSIILSSLHSDNYSNKQTAQTDHTFNDLILMNVCGRLFLLEIDFVETKNMNKQNQQQNGNLANGLTRSMSFNGMFTNPTNQTSINPKIPLVYKVVSVLASGVENVWVNNNSNEMNEKEKRPHLSNALWLACGMRGMGVWLPLLSNDKNPNQSKSFIAKRIMLPISTHIYPLAVLFRDALVLGAENDTIFCGKSQLLNKPFCHVSKTSQVYLHHILRELLKRNLGMHAWDIANSCSSLPYFPHSLELLLHGVLEEEASSSQAIVPDPLLPRVIQFIREFPVFLETVVHCARKTELALWPHLFSIVGNPKELFQQCLDNDKLSTAASYIIVLHNLEQKSISKQYATTLLNKATEKGEMSLVKDLVRFLNAIEPSELTTTTSSITSKVSNLNTVVPSSIHTSKYLLSHSSLGSNLGTTNQIDNLHHNQIMQLSQLNLNKNQMIGRKRTQSSSASLMLQHSNSLESPHSSNPMSIITNSNIATTTTTTAAIATPTTTAISTNPHLVQINNQSTNQLTNGTMNALNINHTTTLTNSSGLTTSTSSLASSSNLSGSLGGNQINQLNNFQNNLQNNHAYLKKSANNIVPPGAVKLYKLMNQNDNSDNNVVDKKISNGSVNRTNSFNRNDNNKSNSKEMIRRHSMIAETSNCKLN